MEYGGRITVSNKSEVRGRAIGEFGRIYKTQHLLTYLDDEGYRRKILKQLNRGESRHSLARAIFYGKKGELYQRYQEGQEAQLGALGLVPGFFTLFRYAKSDSLKPQKEGEKYPKPKADAEGIQKRFVNRRGTALQISHHDFSQS